MMGGHALVVVRRGTFGLVRPVDSDGPGRVGPKRLFKGSIDSVCDVVVLIESSAEGVRCHTQPRRRTAPALRSKVHPG